LIKQLFLLAGLPRSGSTLLGTLLNQNSNIYVPHTSPFVEILWRNYSIWNDESYAEDFMGSKMQNHKIPYLKKLFESYFTGLTDKPIIIDKGRSWEAVANIKMFQEIFETKPKIICPVRNVEEIVASYKSLYLHNNKDWSVEFLKGNRFETPFFNLKNTWNSEFKDCLLLIEYNSLIQEPQKTMEQIYDFINQPYYQHNFDNIVSSDPLKEVETFYGLKGMFDLHKKLQRSQTSIDILTEKEYNAYTNKNFWKR